MPDKNGNTGAVLTLKTAYGELYRLLSLKTSGNIYQLGVHSKTRSVKIDTEHKLTDDFISFGVNCVPTNMMEQSIEYGF